MDWPAIPGILARMNSRIMALTRCTAMALPLLVAFATATASEPLTLTLWPGQPPGETKELPPEADQTKDTDRLIAGRRIIKLGNVSTPQIAVFRPPKNKDTGAAVLIAPGGGHHILAYDLEGTEVAEWLNTIGVTGIVLKYRVPTRTPNDKRWLAAVQDAQRAMSLVRSRAGEWSMDAQRIGILGFSAGGQTAVLTALFDQRQYEPVDAVDRVSSRPDFSVIIYPGGLVPRNGDTLADEVKVTKAAPPTFIVMAHDDNVNPLNAALLYIELKKANVPAELHIYAQGGHGYGLRPTELPVTAWPRRCEEWLHAQGILRK
jgi:acetyl esterase/lipase